MSTRKAPENASGSKGLKPWMKNLIFAAVILVLAAALYFGVRAAHSSKGSGLKATVDFGDGITETLPLDPCAPPSAERSPVWGCGLPVSAP